MFVRFKNLKSISENPKKKTSETMIQMNCFSNNDACTTPVSTGMNDFIVTSPAPRIGTRKANKSQSILLASLRIPL